MTILTMILKFFIRGFDLSFTSISDWKKRSIQFIKKMLKPSDGIIPL
jgi:hypothetical protein